MQTWISRTLVVAALLSSLSLAAVAQPKPSPHARPAPTAEPSRPSPTPKAPAEPRPTARPAPRLGQLANVSVEVTLTAWRGEQALARKMGRLLGADGENRMIRYRGPRDAGGAPDSQLTDTPLDLDLRPVIEGSRIRLRLAVQGILSWSGASGSARSFNANEMVNLVLEDGRPLVATTNEGPGPDERITLEVKATILR
jgi:hypothetical protein